MATEVSAVDIELKWNRKDLESLKIVVESCVDQRRVAVQAGACLGVFPEWLAGQFERVYTFEPDPQLHRMTTQRLNGKLNVVIMQSALGATPALVRTACELRPRDGKTVLHPGMTRTERDGDCWIPTFAIDWLALSTCDLIYLDIEGDELNALIGSQDTIKRCRPVVVCEINRGLVYRGHSESDVVEFMSGFGYALFGKLRSDVVFMPKERT